MNVCVVLNLKLSVQEDQGLLLSSFPEFLQTFLAEPFNVFADEEKEKSSNSQPSISKNYLKKPNLENTTDISSKVMRKC